MPLGLASGDAIITGSVDGLSIAGTDRKLSGWHPRPMYAPRRRCGPVGEAFSESPEPPGNTLSLPKDRHVAPDPKRR